MKQWTQYHLAPPHKIETPGRPGARDLCAPSLGHETRRITKDRRIVSRLYIKILQTRWSRDRLERKKRTRILALRRLCTKPVSSNDNSSHLHVECDAAASSGKVFLPTQLNTTDKA